MVSHHHPDLRNISMIVIRILAIVFISIMTLFSSTSRAYAASTISGIVFHDYNDNGFQDTNSVIANNGGGNVSIAVDDGVSGVTVTAYDSNNVVQPTTISAANGTYTLNVSGTAPYRVEFTTLPSGYQPGAHGTSNGTAVQFVPSIPATNVNLGVIIPGEYCVNNPTLAASCFVYGDPINGPNKNLAAFITFPYSAGAPYTNVTANFQVPTTHTAPYYAVAANKVGAVLSGAYSRINNVTYVGAYMKRHSGFGASGTGAIYQVSSTGTVSVFANLNAIFGAGTTGVDPHNPADYDADNGNATWDTVGKISLGGMAIDYNETHLYVMNLADQSIYSIPLSGPINNATVKRQPVPISPPGCTGVASDVRPFAVATNIYNGVETLYVGMVCSAESTTILTTAPNANYQKPLGGGGNIDITGNKAKLIGYVYTVNMGTLAFSGAPVLQIPFNFQHGYAYSGGGFNTSGQWFPWRPDYATHADAYGQPANRLSYAQPMISQLAFDHGNMIIGVRDRSGDQGGHNLHSDPNQPATQVDAISAGDLFRAAGPAPGPFILESNGTSGGVTTGGAGNNQGPGGGEYYYQSKFNINTGAISHEETADGGIAQVPGFPNVVSSVFDPGAAINTGGFQWENNNALPAGGVTGTNKLAGQAYKGYQLYVDLGGAPSPLYGKANGIGLVEPLCNLAPIEIGNRVWSDTNNNGIQNANELGIAGVTVQLLDGATVIGTAITDAFGNYYFSSAVGTTTASEQYGVPIVQGHTYTVRIPNYTGQAALTGLGPSPTANDGSLNGTSRDSNGAVAGANVDASVTTGGAGANDHTIDFGFTPPATATNTATSTSTTTATDTPTFTPTSTVTSTPTATASPTNIATDTALPTATSSLTPTNTTLPTATSTLILTSTSTVTATGTTVPLFDLGNRLWFDTNNDGTLNNGESAVPAGITLTLTGTDSTGNPITRTAITDANGYYRFDNLSGGTYKVTVDATNFQTDDKLQGYLSSNGNTSSNDSHDNGIDNPTPATGGILSGLITLGIGLQPPFTDTNGSSPNGGIGPNGAKNDNLTVDFGFVKAPTTPTSTYTPGGPTVTPTPSILPTSTPQSTNATPELVFRVR